MGDKFSLLSETGFETMLTHPTYIGQHPKCQVQIDGRGVSPYHATLWFDQGQVIIRDENTPTGTYINNYRITQPSYLKPNDHIRIGNHTFILKKQETQVTQDTPSKKVSKKASKQHKLWLIIPVIFALIAIVLIILGTIGFQNYQTLPKVFEGVTEKQLVRQLPGLSPDQIQVLQEVERYPDAFTILFYEETGSNGSVTVRQEMWNYFPENLEYTFFNGEQTAVESIDETVFDLQPTPYRPEFFTAYMSLNDVIAVTQIDRYALIPLEDALIPNAEIFYANQLVFGLKEGQLLYIETLASDRKASGSN